MWSGNVHVEQDACHPPCADIINTCLHAEAYEMRQQMLRAARVA